MSGQAALRSGISGGMRESVWDSVERQGADPILGLTHAFMCDTSSPKLNLGVGVYRDDNGDPFVLPIVRQVEKELSTETELGKEYLPSEGDATFCKLAEKLVFGSSHPVVDENRVCTIQTMSGTLAVYLAAQALKKVLPLKQNTVVLLSNPTWVNHYSIFEDSGYAHVKEYRYWDPVNLCLDFDGMCEDLMVAPKGSILVLQACGHNPTGVDPTKDQWQKIGQIVKMKKHIALFDVAYHGVCSGSIDEDCYSIRYFASLGVEMLVGQSFSKNFTMYGERVGALHVVCSSTLVAQNITRFLCSVLRPIYSSPHFHPVRIISTILSSPTLFERWKLEVKDIADRLIRVRTQLVDALQAYPDCRVDWSFLRRQTGLFCYTNLKPLHVQMLTSCFHIYLSPNGRINLGGLPSSYISYLVSSLCQVLRVQTHL